MISLEQMFVNVSELCESWNRCLGLALIRRSATLRPTNHRNHRRGPKDTMRAIARRWLTCVPRSSPRTDLGPTPYSPNAWTAQIAPPLSLEPTKEGRPFSLLLRPSKWRTREVP